ncbi:hypothetical protein [Stenotrophobium rhamnosiphilum]|uniref:Lysozyme inhibitor LprI N-terminal domain-containing protein n=1 Tax=Stenotrophobium rhamnosiphilum TaxID=2029166 RepID=A0A2T5MBC4_9GAMM|nr:hypothetical protein [Stenotrophobium rhamnosiphilum]PTU28292.1 hypothetical protein CJD38_17820 [Stenotrophobium rhamnosiphilum]
MNWKLALIAIAVFCSACTDNAANGKKVVDSGLKSLEDNLSRQVLDQPAFREALEENKAKWIRVAPGNKTHCTELTHNVFDEGYIRCMNGYEAEVVKQSNGKVQIVQIESPTVR